MVYRVAFFQGEWHAGYYRADGSFVSLGASLTKSGAFEIKDQLYRQKATQSRYLQQERRLCGIRY